MPPDIDLSELSHAEKDDLIRSLLPLAGQLHAALARIAELETRLARYERPKKTPDNSSLPPSQGQKANRGDAGTPPRPRRPGMGRMLEPHPDRVVDTLLETCPHCAASLTAGEQTPQEVYDRIEIPPIRPDVTRVRLFGGQCACCGERVTAKAPPGLEPGSPFGQSVCALVIYLHYAHAIGFERLAALLGELFGLRISEGAISNMLHRAGTPLLAAQSAIGAAVTAAPVVCSDETSARVCGRTCWEWVFVTSRAVLHVIRPNRRKAAVTEVFGDRRPAVWVSDMWGAQRGHGQLWQVCLAHLLRDAQFAIESGDTAFSAPFRLLLLRAVAIGRRRDRLSDAVLNSCAAGLERRLDRILAAVPVGAAGTRLRKRMRANRGALFVFVTDRRVPATNNTSERHLRPSVIFRKVTNGFRSDWGAHTYAAFRSVVSTAKARNETVLDAVRDALVAKVSHAPG